jgi:hypothetical protein
MKKTITAILTLALTLMLTLLLVACGGGGNGGSGTDGKIDVGDLADKALDEAIAENAFSEKAGAAAIKKLGGVDENDITPDWSWRIDESTMMNYGDAGDYGHGSLFFIKDASDDLTEDEYMAWARKVYYATAKVSELGHNCYGWNVGDGSNPDGELSFDEAMGVGSDAMFFMQSWCYKYNGKYLWVNIEQVENPEKESEVTDDFEFIYHYYGAQVDVSVGLQKSFDDTMQDVEDAFEEHGDEIEDALRDYAN